MMRLVVLANPVVIALPLIVFAQELANRAERTPLIDRRSWLKEYESLAFLDTILGSNAICETQ